jgi:hypothetical protein
MALYFCIILQILLEKLHHNHQEKNKTRERTKRDQHIIRNAALAIEDLAQPPKEVNTKTNLHSTVQF